MRRPHKRHNLSEFSTPPLWQEQENNAAIADEVISTHTHTHTPCQPRHGFLIICDSCFLSYFVCTCESHQTFFLRNEISRSDLKPRRLLPQVCLMQKWKWIDIFFTWLLDHQITFPPWSGWRLTLTDTFLWICIALWKKDMYIAQQVTIYFESAFPHVIMCVVANG